MNVRVETVVIGGGQAGLATGYHLARLHRRFVILDAEERVGDAWRRRWDSLRLFTPAKYDALPGDRFPADRRTFPTKDEFADYLESYAERFELPVLSGARVDSLRTQGPHRYVVTAGNQRFEADNVVVAMAGYQRPVLPAFAAGIAPEIVQLHSSAYVNPEQLPSGGVLVVGAANSGSEIALELAATRHIWLSGRDTGQLPFRIDGPVGRRMVPFVLRFVFHRVLTVRTPVGRRVRPTLTSQGGPLIRVKPRDLAEAGVTRVPKVTAAADGVPQLADGRRLDVRSIVWCTGYRPGFSWIGLPAVGDPTRNAGVSPDYPGLYFVGLHFQYSLSSAMIHGAGRDAQRVADRIARTSASERHPTARATDLAGRRV